MPKRVYFTVHHLYFDIFNNVNFKKGAFDQALSFQSNFIYLSTYVFHSVSINFTTVYCVMLKKFYLKSRVINPRLNL